MLGGISVKAGGYTVLEQHWDRLEWHILSRKVGESGWWPGMTYLADQHQASVALGPLRKPTSTKWNKMQSTWKSYIFFCFSLSNNCKKLKSEPLPKYICLTLVLSDILIWHDKLWLSQMNCFFIFFSISPIVQGLSFIDVMRSLKANQILASKGRMWAITILMWCIDTLTPRELKSSWKDSTKPFGRQTSR